MKLLVFDWIGKMAHFRKLDTNSSSLSYAFPSRTTIAGMIAGVLGYEKESYYELFSPDHCHIAVSIQTPIRKMTQTVNYLFVKSVKSDVNGVKGHTQIPVEFVLPGLGYNQLVYRLYFWHEDQVISERLKDKLLKKASVYPPYMGISELLSTLQFVEEVPAQVQQAKQEKVRFSTVIPIHAIQARSLEINPSLRFVKEWMTRSFNQERAIVETERYLMEVENRITVVPTIPYYTVKYTDQSVDNLIMM
ncbi:type I-B CRISPR-associated protein Cas5b [Rubeoparvulum massiliense]|uniref:type I-B CRISPR-associated protein Cas5b n=1 Tax=Rubeoparvulum massiliense TaxID=1631346 RepID=UPI00065E08CA|nr:type I-B CRISPR-associated protein Cas5b [Rubeoparvulum massiliense]